MTEAERTELVIELQKALQRLAPSGIENGDIVLDERSQARKRAIVEALNRVRAGTYGTCVGCREPIAYERLSAIPEAAICAACLHPREGVAS